MTYTVASGNYVVWQNDSTRSQVIVANGVTVTNNDPGVAGALSLGTVNGINLNLISPAIMADGSVYYFLDASGSGAASNDDRVSHNALDTLLNGGADTTGNAAATAGVDSDRSIIVNGYTLILPTYSELLALWNDPLSNPPSGWGAGAYYWGAALYNTTAQLHEVILLDSATTPARGSFGDPNVAFTALRVFAPTSPVVLDLNRDGTLSYTQQFMDVNTDGVQDFSAWVSPQDGVLLWNRFGDGLIHDKSQYSFSQFMGQTDLEGLAAQFDSNHDGVLDASDAQFGEFMVWQDANANGLADAGETHSLSELGLLALNLHSDGVNANPATGVYEAGRTRATLSDGGTMLAADAAFVFQTVQTIDLDAVLNGAEADMANGQAERLTLHAADVLSLPVNAQGLHQLRVLGDASDSVELGSLLAEGGGSWTQAGHLMQDGHRFNVYHHSGDATLQVLIEQQVVQSQLPLS